MYKKDGDDILEYRIVPEREESVRRFTQAQFNKLIADETIAVAGFDKIKYGTVAYDAKVAKLAELNAAKTDMEV